MVDFGFFKDWEAAGEVRIGPRLMRSISTFPVFVSLSTEAELIPDGYEDAGYAIARYDLAAIRYTFAADLAGLLASKCSLLAHDVDDEDNGSDIQVLMKLLGYVLDKKTTHFELG